MKCMAKVKQKYKGILLDKTRQVLFVYDEQLIHKDKTSC